GNCFFTLIPFGLFHRDTAFGQRGRPVRLGPAEILFLPSPFRFHHWDQPFFHQLSCSPPPLVHVRASRTLGTHLATLEEGRPPECVPPASLEASSLKKSSWGALFTGIVGGTLVAVYAVATPFITPALRRICLPFVPATTKQIENVVKMLQCRSGPLVDIGSGDGRIVIAAAKEGFTAVGYELNPWLVWYSRYRAWREGVQASARFYISDLWKVTFSQYSNVVIFGVPQMMAPLEEKLELELQDDARVIACRFPFPHWTPAQVTGEGIDTVWAYDARAFRGGGGRP
uniref:ATP synthase subunit C lysine N-methyltransferase n=1 Tax=Capra hircus TaxID=9925 RepID=A0A8C2S6S7_CAPHI